MDYRCRLGLLCNSSTALRRSDPGRRVGPSYIRLLGFICFLAICISFHIHSSRLSNFLFLYLI